MRTIPSIFKKNTFNACLVIIITAAVIFSSACKTGNSGEDSDITVVTEANLMKSTSERDTSPELGEGDLNKLVTDNTTFALNLYQVVREKQGNLLFSPLSISIALAMTYAGARNNTEAQMGATLHFNLSQSRLHSAFNALDLALNSRGEGGPGSEGEGFRLNIVNATWGQDDFPFIPEFLDVLAINYGAGMYIVDFIFNPESARLTINDWVAEQTNDRIEDLLPPGSITIDTRLVLTNAIYFYASWALPFNKDRTRDADFFLIDGSAVTVPMMSLTGSSGENGETLKAASFDGYQTVELPYQDEELSMVIIIPDTGRFFEIEQGLDAEMLDQVVGALAPGHLDITMPKFGYEFDFSMKDTLIRMGMPDAFDMGRADFSGIVNIQETQRLFISDVVHKAFISVDEDGTEAAAATAVIIGIVSVPTSITINRPFIYFIRDIETRAILFIGRVLNPA
jgi:serpin B